MFSSLKAVLMMNGLNWVHMDYYNLKARDVK